MLTSFVKNPKEAETYKFPEFEKVTQAEAQVPNVPGAAGFTRFDSAQSLPKEAPKPVVRNVTFENLKPLDPGQ